MSNILEKPLHFEEAILQSDGSIDSKAQAALIKTTFYNVELLNALLQQPETKENNIKIDEIIEIFHTILSPLHTIKFFHFFRPSELLAFSEDLGRTILVIEYLKSYFNELPQEEQGLLGPILESLKEEEI